MIVIMMVMMMMIIIIIIIIIKAFEQSDSDAVSSRNRLSLFLTEV